MNTRVRLSTERQVSFAEGFPFGDTGPYERSTGSAFFELDPGDPANANVVDLQLAPRNADGAVEFRVDLDILKPVDLARGNGRLLYDVNNRGNKTALRAFNDSPPDNDPLTLTSAGNGFLMRQGYTVVWSAWQGDLLPGDGLLTADLPEALEDGQPVRGRVRQEFIAEQEGVLWMPLSGAPSIRSYPALDLDTSHATMTVREHERDPRVPVPPGAWAFAEAEMVDGALQVRPSATACHVQGGFKPGWIYELVYETAGSRVMGLGLVGIRDLVSMLLHDDADAAGSPNPLAGHQRAYMYGQSLSSRVIRQFIYDGYNADPEGRRVFDAVYPHVSGGGRLFANARFAQVGRYPRQHEEHQWPSERYPFAYSAVPDAFSDKVDGVLKRPESDPLVVHTHTNTEYWNRHASLGHTDPRTGDDIEFPDTVRVYFLASAQHMGANLAPEDVSQQRPNVMSNGPLMRACLALMDRWATEGAPPPPSIVPRRTDGTLVTPGEALEAFPKVPGFALPVSPSRLPLYDYGPAFEQGMVTELPPQPVPGKEYTVQMPQVDEDGNDLGGLRSPEIAAPVGTHTGWSLRRAGFAEGDLASLTGSFVPFALTRAEREASGDPRLSIEERYGSHDAYVARMADAARELVTAGFLLEEDAARYVEAAKARNPLDPSIPLAPLVLSKDVPVVRQASPAGAS
ncbi:MAG: alpha/beta hydrolase domain-containing protein [Chloroflexota bacterium]|nr:alpha/beta hydrolase domain-containing protein [Chloroflexota bacterium]